MKRRVGFTAGALDFTHAGHFLMLKECKEHCDKLIVALQSDPSIDRPEKNKPILSMKERRIILEGIKYVDEVVEYDTEEDLVRLLKRIKPDVRFLGEDWKGKKYTGHKLKIPVFWNTRKHQYSSSNLRRKIYHAERLPIFFDMDGTVTGSKQQASKQMLNKLRSIKFVIVSGQTIERIRYQVPGLDGVYLAQNGNHAVEVRGGVIHEIWKKELSSNQKQKILEHIKSYADIKEDQLEDRGCQISYSFVGHNADINIKKKFDPDGSKRAAILKKVPFPSAYIGGTTTIDYIPINKGENIKKYCEFKGINPFETFYVGDALFPKGNDESVQSVMPTFSVTDSAETLKLPIWGWAA